jgi:hypothetical protein
VVVAKEPQALQEEPQVMELLIQVVAVEEAALAEMVVSQVAADLVFV